MTLIQQITVRSENASPKIRQRIEEIIIPNLEFLGSMGSRWLNGLHNDFYVLAKDPSDPCGNGNYDGWNAEEIAELFTVLFGEEF